jgi:hypothetical protein
MYRAISLTPKSIPQFEIGAVNLHNRTHAQLTSEETKSHLHHNTRTT